MRIFLSILFLGCALSVQGANVRNYFINSFTGLVDTNSLIITRISTNILANGGVISQGNPTRTPFSPYTNFLDLGFYSVSNTYLKRAYVINVADSGSQLYDYTNIIYSGFNTYAYVYGSNVPPTLNQITNALGYLPSSITELNFASNKLQMEITAATNSGITASQATNISAYQAQIATNRLVPTLNGKATNLTVYASGAPSTKSISVRDIINSEQFYVDDEGVFVPQIGSTGGARLVGVDDDEKLVLFEGAFTNAINATNIYGAGLTQMTNAALLVSQNATNKLDTDLRALVTATTNGLNTRLLNTNSALVAQIVATNTALEAKIVAATNNFNGTNIMDGSIRTNEINTTFYNFILAQASSATGNGIVTNNGSGTNNYFVGATNENSRITNSLVVNSTITNSTIVNPAFLGTDAVGIPLTFYYANAIVGRVDPEQTSQAPSITLGFANTNHGSPGAYIAGGSNHIAGFQPFSVIAGGRSNVITGATNSSVLFHLGGNVISGGFSNLIADGSGENSNHENAIGGGAQNKIYDGDEIESIIGGSVVPGGFNNVISNAAAATIGGGSGNSILGLNWATIGGGEGNKILRANGAGQLYGATILGGYINLAASNYSTVLGGARNYAIGEHSTVAGLDARSTNTGTFVYADASGTAFNSVTDYTFIVRATNGIGLNTNNPGGFALRVRGTSDLPGITSLAVTNTAHVATNLSIGPGVVLQYVTNNIAVTNAGSTSANGTYQYVSGALFTNHSTAAVITNTGSAWQIKSGVTVLYSSATLENSAWTIQSGSSPAARSYYGSVQNMDGMVIRGYISSTNLDARFVAANLSGTITNNTTGNAAGATNLAGKVFVINSGIIKGGYATLTAAKNAAVAGDTVYATAGTYAENDLAKDGVNWRGDPGANIVYVQTTTNDAGMGLFDDRGKGPIRMSFDWPGKMVLVTVTNVLLCDTNDLFPLTLNPNSLAVLSHTNPASQYLGHIGEVSAINYLDLQFFLLNQSFGSNSQLRVDRMIDLARGAALDLAPYADPGNNMAAPSVNGWFVGETYRYGILECPYINVSKQSWYWLEQTTTAKTNDFYLRGGYIKGNMYGVSLTPLYKGWANGFELDGSTYTWALANYGGGRWYFDFGKIANAAGGLLNLEAASGGTVTNGEVWVSSQKWEANGLFVAANAGTTRLNVDHFVDLGGVGANGITNKAGTLVVPFYSISGRTNISAAATSLVVTFPHDTYMPGTNYTPSINLGFNPVAIASFSGLTRSNFTVNFSTGVTTGGTLWWEAKQNTQ